MKRDVLTDYFAAAGVRNPRVLADKLIDCLGEYNLCLRLTEDLSRAGAPPRVIRLIQAIPSVAESFIQSKLTLREPANNPERAYAQISADFIHASIEEFRIYGLNSQNVIFGKKAFVGTLSEVPVYVREVVKFVLSINAHSVIFAHNHPGNSLIPSTDDINITTQLVDALKTIEVQVRDHFIITDSGYMSFKQHNYF